MIGSGRLQLVFINQHEVYYCGSQCTLDSAAYLWLHLHRNNCGNVYFLSYSQMWFHINDYADKESIRFTRNGLINKKLSVATEESQEIVHDINMMEFSTTVLPLLENQRSSLIMRLTDYYSMLEAEEMCSMMNDYLSNCEGKSRLFLVVTPDSAKLLSSDRLGPYIHNVINDTNFFDGILSNAYRDHCYDNQLENCIFLDHITRSDIQKIIYSVAMKQQSVFESINEVDRMVDYLCVISDETVPVDYNFGFNYKIRKRKDYYDYLSAPRGWEKLYENSKHISKESFTIEYPQEMLSHVISYTDDTIEEMVRTYNKFIQKLWDDDNDSLCYIKYCLMRLHRILNIIEAKSLDYDSIGLTIIAMNVFLSFADKRDMTVPQKKYICNSLLEYYTECIRLSGSIYSDQEIVKHEAKSEQSRKSVLAKKELDKIEARIEKSKEKLGNQLDELSAIALKLRVSREVNDVVPEERLVYFNSLFDEKKHINKQFADDGTTRSNLKAVTAQNKEEFDINDIYISLF